MKQGHWVIRATKPNGTTKREVREHYDDAIALAEMFDDYYPDRTVTVFFKEFKMSKTIYPEYVKSVTQREAFDQLKELLKPGQTVYTKLNTVSRNGMSRYISVYIVEEGQIRDISWLVNKLNGKAIPDRGGVKMGGCGMDMGFALVYGLSRTLWHEGYRCNGSDGYTPTGKKSKKPRCGSNDHSNGEPRKAGKHHRDGGYALNQEWL